MLWLDPLEIARKNQKSQQILQVLGLSKVEMRAIKNKLQVNSVAEFVTLFNSTNREDLCD